MDAAALSDWVARYEAAWRTAGTGPLAALFTADARYSRGPYGPVHVGLADIAAFWEAERDGADEPFTLAWEPVARQDEVGVVRVEVAYGRGTSYRDLWIVALRHDGRCRSFEEWPFAPDQPLVQG